MDTNALVPIHPPRDPFDAEAREVSGDGPADALCRASGDTRPPEQTAVPNATPDATLDDTASAHRDPAPVDAYDEAEELPLHGPHGEGRTVFAPRRQAAFLRHLQMFGNVRLACRAARVSAQTAYRQRRVCAALARAWDAALLAARAHAEATLADRAIHGVEVKVYYHGEEIATRRRYSDRLLLAHLARLDRLEARADIAATLGALDAAIEALEAGATLDAVLPGVPADEGSSAREAAGPGADGAAGGGAGARAGNLPQDRVPPVPVCGDGPDAILPQAGAAPLPAEPPCACAGAVTGMDRGRRHYRVGGKGWTPVLNICGEGPCCDAPRWPDCGECPHYPPAERLQNAMDDARPHDAPSLGEMGDPGAVEAAQVDAFEAGEAQWWRRGVGGVLFARDAAGRWVPELQGLEAAR